MICRGIDHLLNLIALSTNLARVVNKMTLPPGTSTRDISLSIEPKDGHNIRRRR